MHLANTYIEYLLGRCLDFMDVIKQATDAWEGNDAWLLSYRTDIWELLRHVKSRYWKGKGRLQALFLPY